MELLFLNFKLNFIFFDNNFAGQWSRLHFTKHDQNHIIDFQYFYNDRKLKFRQPTKILNVLVQTADSSSEYIKTLVAGHLTKLRAFPHHDLTKN